MEKIDFPWLQNSGPDPEPESPPPPQTKWVKALAVARPFFPVLALGAVLIVLFLTRTGHSSSASEFKHLEALIPLVPISKGDEILPETLKAVPLERRDFSKSQMLQLAHADDVSRLRGKLRAKKNIPPHHIIFWTDLDFKKPSFAPKADSHPQIFFAPEAP